MRTESFGYLTDDHLQSIRMFTEYKKSTTRRFAAAGVRDLYLPN